MEQWMLLILGCTVLTVRFTASNNMQNGIVHRATVTDVRGIVSKNSRCFFGDYVQLTINIPTIDSIQLKLSRNAATGLNNNVHVIRRSIGGSGTFVKKEVVTEITNFELYQDVARQASIGIECEGVETEVPKIRVSGVVYYFDKNLIIRPSEKADDPELYDVIVAEQTFVGNDYRLAPTDTKPPYLKRGREGRSKGHSLVRRDVDITQPFIVDVLVVVDYSIYNYWYLMNTGNTISEKLSNTQKDIRRYFAHVINGADLRYKLIPDVDMKISIKLAGYVIADSPDVYPWSEIRKENAYPKSILNADTALSDFRNWVRSTSNLPHHDYALLFTGYDLYTEMNGQKYNYTSGLAYIGTLCRKNGDSVSVVEEHGGFQSIGVTAHEIGHGLGSLHDGDDNGCKSTDRYIMAGFGYGAVPETERLNQWQFSSCSINSFREFITAKLSDGASCLTDSVSFPDAPDVTSEMPGQMYDVDEQCKLIWGQTSYLCRGIEFGNASSLCTAMYCRDPSTNNECVLHTAARGTTCGNKKWCVDGICSHSTIAPERPADCVLGDDPGIAFEGYTCAGLVAKSSSYCYQDVVRARCCQSCKTAFTGIQDCEYGNRAIGCTLAHCNSLDQDQNYLSTCCGTCNIGVPIDQTTQVPVTSVVNHTTTQPVIPDGCRDTVTINSKTCSEFIGMYGSQICYQGHISQSCCATCSTYEEPATGCPFGDRIPSMCVSARQANATWCRLNKYDCCRTCAQVSSSGGVSWSSFLLGLMIINILVFL